MNKQRLIVYPDADGDMAALIAGPRLARLEALGRFTIHHRRPADDTEYRSRIDGAAGLLLGWDLPARVMAAATPPLEIVAFSGSGAGSFVDLDWGKSRQGASGPVALGLHGKVGKGLERLAPGGLRRLLGFPQLLRGRRTPWGALLLLLLDRQPPRGRLLELRPPSG